MRHLHSGRKLGRSPDHRRATLRSLTLALIENDTIKTMPSRAKELRWYAERAITLAKRGDVAGRRKLVQMLGSSQTFIVGENRVRNAIEKVYSDLVPRFKDRSGGYTQIFRLATRRAGDNAEMCVMRYIPPPENQKTGKKAKASGGDKAKAGSTKEAKQIAAAAPAEDKPAIKKTEKEKKPGEAQDKKSTKAKKKE